MRNTWLILKREYLERVRTRSFLVLTLLLPGIMTVLMALPAKLATMGQKAQRLDVDANPTEAERADLRDKVSTRAIDGCLWLTDDAIASHKIVWYSREMMGFRERSWLSETIS